MKKLIFLIMVLFSLTMAFSGCSKSPLKSKESLGPFSLIPDHAFSTVNAINYASSLKVKEYKKLGTKQVLILQDKERKWCNNIIKKNPKIMKKEALFNNSSINNNLVKLLNSYNGRVYFNCSSYTEYNVELIN
jgi:5-formaminoimidazole-4-carboxamide-1-beta-D-ribofuranosyl 5'-monophosphate synthetase